MMIDGGLLMGRYNDVNHAAQEGARLAATGATDVEIRDRVRAQAQGALDGVELGCSGDEYICVTYSDAPDPDRNSAGEVGSTVMVVVRYRYDMITPFINKLSDNIEAKVCAAARLERPVPSVANSGDNEC